MAKSYCFQLLSHTVLLQFVVLVDSDFPSGFGRRIDTRNSVFGPKGAFTVLTFGDVVRCDITNDNIILSNKNHLNVSGNNFLDKKSSTTGESGLPTNSSVIALTTAVTTETTATTTTLTTTTIAEATDAKTVAVPESAPTYAATTRAATSSVQPTPAPTIVESTTAAVVAVTQNSIPSTITTSLQSKSTPSSLASIMTTTTTTAKTSPIGYSNVTTVMKTTVKDATTTKPSSDSTDFKHEMPFSTARSSDAEAAAAKDPSTFQLTPKRTTTPALLSTTFPPTTNATFSAKYDTTTESLPNSVTLNMTSTVSITETTASTNDGGGGSERSIPRVTAAPQVRAMFESLPVVNYDKLRYHLEDVIQRSRSCLRDYKSLAATMSMNNFDGVAAEISSATPSSARVANISSEDILSVHPLPVFDLTKTFKSIESIDHGIWESPGVKGLKTRIERRNEVFNELEKLLMTREPSIDISSRNEIVQLPPAKESLKIFKKIHTPGRYSGVKSLRKALFGNEDIQSLMNTPREKEELNQLVKTDKTSNHRKPRMQIVGSGRKLSKSELFYLHDKAVRLNRLLVSRRSDINLDGELLQKYHAIQADLVDLAKLLYKIMRQGERNQVQNPLTQEQLREFSKLHKSVRRIFPFI